MACNHLCLLGVAYLRDERRVNSVHMLLEAAQLGPILDCASKALDVGA